MSIDSSAMDRYLKENNITLPKELERIRNMTMGDVVLENLQRHLGDDLKLSGSGKGLKEKKKARKAKKNSQEPTRPAGGGGNAVKYPEPSFENIAAKPAPGAKKKPGTITAAEFAKLQKSYTKYKQENTPHSFGGASSIARTTDYTKWDKFASGLDDEEVKSRPSATAGKDETGVPGETASALSDEQSRFWMKVTTVVLSFGISVTLAYTFGIESTFVKQVMFGISAVIIFNFLLQKENARIIRTSNTLSMEEQEKKKK
jgi:hypothetical protein